MRLRSTSSPAVSHHAGPHGTARRQAARLALATLLAFATARLAHAQAPLAAEACTGCHGTAGRGASPIAALAGRPAEELLAAMAAFRANDRPATIMGRIARGFTEAETAAMAAYFASLPAAR